MREEWRNIPNLSNYQASDRGRIRSLDRMDPLGRKQIGKILKGRVSVEGKTYTPGRLVALTWLGPMPPGHTVIPDESPLGVAYVPKSNTRGVVRSDGKTYLSLGSASREAGISPAGIRNCCKGNQPSAGGYSWAYIS